ncbi:MAG: amino acid decarboxylase [Oscillospiraceae bacterium]|nr:amino acid decarboxylase [Oscillospiraceae bacterium]
MTTPVWDFVRRYAGADAARLHMPGHKGVPLLGCEPLDITEVQGAGELYGDSALLTESRQNAAALFGSGATLYSTEGSSLCVRAMAYLALTLRPNGTPPVILAARNVHRSFVSALALCGGEAVWLWPETRRSLCACEIPPAALEKALDALPAPPAAVYVTSPDYLGGLADIPGLSAACHARGVPLLADNAHGAALRFLDPCLHPLALGADLCCDSAHKTLPVLTGGAYLHLSARLPAAFFSAAEGAMALFASTSPSWLTLASLDRCNALLADTWPRELRRTAKALEKLRQRLARAGWTLRRGGDPLRLTLAGDGAVIAARLREGGVEPEYADRDFCVLMASPGNPQSHLDRVADALGENDLPPRRPVPLCMNPPERVCSVREAVFAPRETVPLEKALGRVCAGIPAACPPAVPVCVPGERLDRDALALLRALGHRSVEVLTER